MSRAPDRGGGGGAPPFVRAEVDLAALCAALEKTAADLGVTTGASATHGGGGGGGGDDGDAPHVARLDALDGRLTEAGLAPPLPPRDALASHIGALDADASRWFALAISVLDHPPVRAALPGLLRGHRALDVLDDALLDPSRELARRAPSDAPGWFAALKRWLAPLSAASTATAVRPGGVPALEVLARMVLARLGAAIAGEHDARARDVLAELDHQRLLADLPRAKAALKTTLPQRRNVADDDQDIRLPPRGKW